MTTVHITNAYHPTSGGIKTFYHALLAAAPRHARRVHLVVPGACDGIEQVNPFATIHTIRAGRAPIVDRRYRLILPHRFIRPGAGALWPILDREQPDLIEVCDKYSLCYLAGLMRTLRRTRPALVGLTCERMDDNVRAVLGHAPWTARFAKRYLRDVYLPQFDAHIANSAYTAAEIPRNPRHPRPVYVRHMGVDTTTFTPDRGNRWRRDRRRAALGVPLGAPLLIYAGRLSAEKHVHLLLDMMRHLGSTRARLVLAGDGPLRESLARRAAADAPGRVHFLPNIADRAELADLFADADLFVHPNPREPFGIAPLEAMAAGLPLVVPDQGGVTSYAGAENAWPAAPTGPALAFAVVNALVDEPERERRRRRALATAAAHSWPAAAAAYFELYDDIVYRRLRATEPTIPVRAPDTGATTRIGSLSR